MISFHVPQLDIPNITLQSVHFDKITFSKIMLEEIDKNGYLNQIYFYIWLLPILLLLQVILLFIHTFYFHALLKMNKENTKYIHSIVSESKSEISLESI